MPNGSMCAVPIREDRMKKVQYVSRGTSLVKGSFAVMAVAIALTAMGTPAFAASAARTSMQSAAARTPMKPDISISSGTQCGTEYLTEDYFATVCIQVIGSGTHVSSVTGWITNSPPFKPKLCVEINDKATRCATASAWTTYFDHTFTAYNNTNWKAGTAMRMCAKNTGLVEGLCSPQVVIR
jgi:hypothetical protein